jgi:nitrogen fixation-related uncharacterized protein
VRADLSLVLYYASLGMSAVAVVLFLWLMREPEKDDRDRRRDSRSD